MERWYNHQQKNFNRIADGQDTKKLPRPENNNINPRPNLKSLISEIGFHEKLPENKACVQFLEAIRPKSKEEDNQTTEIVDLVSPVESPQKTQIIGVLVVTNIQNQKLTNVEPDDRRDELEEHQEKHNKDDQEIEAGAQQTEKEK